MSDGAQAPWGPARHSWGLQPDPTAGSRPLHQPPGATQAQALCPGSCHLGQGPPFASKTDSCGLWEGVLGTEMQVTDDNGWPSARVLPPSLCPLLGGLCSCPLGSGAAPSPELTLGGLSRPDAGGRPLGCGARRPRCLRWPRPPGPSLPCMPLESPLLPASLGVQDPQPPQSSSSWPRSPHRERARAADAFAD